ncbi:microtubule-associated protein futsch-like isoform X6 [Notothenia coriiceps]|uniref:Microtubule-associated protein futsch-like isoform X6 n=1 Tax=Notothenia coriiceps TaxID=8208 RepID=A0A6I9N172_9TELE|nr:PREDICTED: microtubule-associated protein futsch-like isoform X6 [Notothenia coriiceps]
MSGPHPGPGRETHQSGCPLTPGRDLAASRHHDHRIGLNMSASSLKHASMYGFTKTEHSSSSSSSSYSPLRRLQHLTSMVSQPDLVLPVREPERSWEWGGNKKERGKEMETDSWADCTSGDYSGSQNTSREESYCGSSSGPKQPVVQSRSRDIPAAPDVSEKKTEGLFSGPPSPAFSLDSNSPFANGFLHFESSLFEDDDEEQDAVSPLDRGLDKHDRPENLIPSTPGNVNSDSKDATLSSAKVVTRSQSSGQRRRYWDGSDDEWESGSELLLLDDSPTRHSMQNSFKKKAVPSLKFLEGEVIWAKLNRRPWWPCEVTVDPAQGIYHKVKEPSDRPSRLYHVRTFGEPLELTWVEEKSTHSFHGGFEFDQLPLLRRKGKQREQNYKNTIAKRLQDSWKSSVAEAEFVVQARHQMSSSFPSFIDDDFQDSFSPETERKANPTFTPSTSPTLPETFYMTNGSISPPITTPAKPSTLNKSSGKKQPSKSSKDSCSKHSKKSKTLRNSPDQSERDNGECPYSDIDSVPKILCPKALERQSKLTTTQPLVTIVKEVKKQPEIQTGLWFTKSGKDRRPKTTSSKSDRTLFSKVPCKKKNSFAASKKSLLPTSFSTSSEQLGFSDRHKTPGETKLSPEQPVHLKCKNTVIAKKPFVTTSSTPYKSSLSDNRKTLEPAESNLITEQPQHLKFKNTLVANTSLGTTASPTEHSWFSEKHNTLVPAETNLQHKQPGHFKCFNTKVANRPFSTSVSTNDLSGLSDKQSSLVFDKLDVPFDKCRYSKDRKTDCNTIEPVTVLPLDQLGRSHVKKNIKPSPLIFNDQSMLSVKTVSQTPHSDTMANYKVHPIDRISDQAEEKQRKKLSVKKFSKTQHSDPMASKTVHVIDSISDQAEEKESQKLSKKKANPTQHSDTMVNKKVHEIDSISDQAEEKESQKLSKKKANPTQHSDTMVNKKVHEIDSISDQAEEKESKMLSKKRARLTLHSDTVVNKKVHEIDSISEQAAEKESKRLSKKRASLTQHSNTMADKKYTVVDGMSDQSEEKESKTLRVKTVRQNPHSDMLATKNIHAIDRVSDQRGDKQIQKLSVKSFSRTKHSDRMSDEIVHVVERMSDRSEEMKIKKLSAKIVSHTQRSDLVASQEVQAIDRVSDQAEKKERKQSSVKRVSQTEDSDTKTDKKVQVIDRVSDQAEKKERKQCATRISHSQHSDLVASQEVQAIDRVSDQSEEKERKKLIVKRVSQTEDSDTLANKKVQVIDKVSDQAEGKERKRLSAKKIIHTQHSETEANNKVEVIERVSDMAEENTSSARLNVDAFDPIARLEMQTSLLSKCRLPFVKLIRKDMKGKKFLNSTVTLNPNDQPGCTKDEIPDAEVPEMSSKQSDWVNGKASISIDRAVSSESIKISVKKVKASGGTGVLRLSSESLHDKPIVTSKVANVLDELGSQESERVPVLNVSNMTYSLSNQSEGRKTLASNESSMTTDQLGNSEQKMTSANSTAFDKTPSSVKAKKVVSKLKLVSDEVNRIVLHEQPTHLPASGRLMTRALKAMQEVEETKREKVRKKAEHKELLNLYKTTEHVACNSASNSKLDFCTEIKTRTDNDFDQDTSSSSTSPLTRPDSADLDVKSEDEDLSISSTPPMDFIPLTSRVKAKNEDQSSDMQRSSSAPSSPFSFINSFKNIEEVSFQSLTNEGEGKPISFKADTSYKFSTFLMMLKDLHDTREREGTPLELDIGPPSAHVKEEPLVMPGEATSAGQDPQIKQVKNDSNSSPDKVENKHNEGSTSQTSKRPYKRRISSTRVKKKANREVPCRPARSGPGFPGLESLPTTDSSSGLDCSSRDKSLFGIEASSWERHAGGAEGVVGEEDDTWSRVNENLQNMVPLEQRGCDTTLCLEQPNGLVADGTETTTSFMRDTGGSDKAPKAHKRIRKPSKRLIEWTEEYDQIFSTRKKIKKPLQLIGKETQPVMSEHPGSDSSSQDDHPSLNLPPEIQTPPPEEIPTTTPSALQIPNTENTSTQDAPVLSIDTLTPPPEADHLLSEGLVKGNGSAPVLERKRKRKPTQKILEYCMEAEASAGPKKKVKTLKNNSNPAPQSDAGPPSLKSKTRQPTASSSTEVSSSSTTDPPPKSPAPSPPAPPSPEPTLEETPSADIDAPQAEDKKESTESEAEPSCLDQASPP